MAEKDPDLSVFDTRFGIPGRFHVVSCSGCGFESIEPFPTQDFLTDLYCRYYNFGGDNESFYARLRKWFLFSPLYRFWLACDGDISFHAIQGTGSLLDVGCNEGRGLEFYRRNGFEVEGLELNSVAVQSARRSGFKVHEVLLQDFTPEELLSRLVLSNVLEHTLDPEQMLKDANRVLGSEGQIWISCPNSASIWRRYFGKAWINWHVPFHVFHFNEASLRKLLNRAGFEVISAETVTPSLWLTQSFISRWFAREGRKTKELRNPLLLIPMMLLIRGMFFPFLVFTNRKGKGDCLVVRARKVCQASTQECG